MTKSKFVITDIGGTVANVFTTEDLQRLWIDRFPEIKADLERLVHSASINQRRALIFVRPGAVESLKRLDLDSNLVIASRMENHRLRYLIDYFKSQGLHFDSVYGKEQIAVPSPQQIDVRNIKNYSKIYHDFGIRSDEVEKRVVVLEDIRLTHQEIDLREGSNLIRDPSTNHYTTKGTPLPYQGQVPVTILLPSPLFQEHPYNTIDMASLPDTIAELFRLGQGDFSLGFTKFNDPKFKKVETGIHKRVGGPKQEGFANHYTALLELYGNFIHRYLILRGSQFDLKPYEPLR